MVSHRKDLVQVTCQEVEIESIGNSTCLEIKEFVLCFSATTKQVENLIDHETIRKVYILPKHTSQKFSTGFFN